ncbi:MAG: fructose-bisphosphate aldolase class I [Betaproteobacteria bacterium]|nr:fructose-bisphosphate aldolase class I [Betaproteobacteria bacterium]
MFERELATTAAAMVAPGKGILAIDESGGTIKKRFDSIGVESTVENRRAYRDLLITANGLSQFISGMILYDETIRQAARDGTPFAQVLKKNGILAGIKVDTGAKSLAGAPGEQVTEGLDGLRERLAEYKKMGAMFAKWRAVITIGKDIPSDYCITANAHALARYAALCQEAGMVPIVEPEVLMDGNHTLERCFDVTEITLQTLFHELHRQRVRIEHSILKASMVISGKDCPQQASVQQVAEATIRCLRRTVPAALPGIVFLSGGQSDEHATAHLNAMNAAGAALPWPLSFSYGRALQAPALKAWKGQAANVAAAQQALFHRSKCNSAACFGRYQPEMEKEVLAA